MSVVRGETRGQPAVGETKSGIVFKHATSGKEQLQLSSQLQLGQRRDLRMERANGYESLEYDIARLREEQKQIVNALKTLFDLLEEYAPSWYTEEHHRQALSALEVTAERRQ